MQAVPSARQSASHRAPNQLERLLVTLDVDVHSFALCAVQRGSRLVAEPVDAIMVHYVLSGTHHMAIGPHSSVVASAGSIVLIPPNFRPRVALDGGPATDVMGAERSTLTREGLLLINATSGGQPELRFISGIVHASLSGSFGLFDNLTQPIAQHVGQYGIVQHAFDLMVAEVGQPNLGARALTSALMKTCLLLMIRQTLECDGGPDSMLGAFCDKRLSKSIAAVLDRPADAHTVDTLAEVAGMSRSTFCRNFSSAFDMSPRDFVARTRLHHAAQMLRSTPLPVKSIAGSVGFSSRSHFSRAFRAAYGLDPTEFRCATRNRPTDVPKLSVRKTSDLE